MQARATGPGLALNFWFDNQLVGSLQLHDEFQQFEYQFEDSEGSHEFEIELLGKLPEHTELDTDGNIVHDRVAEIANVALDNIELGHMFYEQTCYLHDFNGVGQPIEQKFFGTMGCNGRVKLQFSSPVYLWLLENM